MWMIIPVRTSERHESQHINNWKHTTCTDVEQCFPADLYHTPKRFISHYRSVFWTFPTHTYCFPANCSLSLSVFQSDSDLAKQKQTLTGWDLFVSASDNTFGDQSQEHAGEEGRSQCSDCSQYWIALCWAKASVFCRLWNGLRLAVLPL